MKNSSKDLELIYQNQLEHWSEKNINFFGVKPRNWGEMSHEDIVKALEEDKNNYWTEENPCEFFAMIMAKDKKILEDYNKGIKDSLHLVMNPYSECVEIRMNIKVIRKVRGVETEQIKERLVAAIPTPNDDLSWTINSSKYIPRVTSVKDWEMLSYIENGNEKLVKHNYQWTYDLNTKEFTIADNLKDKKYDPYENLSNRNKEYLKSISGFDEITKDNFEEAMTYVPENQLSPNSIYRFKFAHIENFFDLLRNATNYGSLSKGVPFGANIAFIKANQGNETNILNRNNPANKLVLFKSKLQALEEFKMSIYEVTKHVEFSYEDASLFMDAFKTSTSQTAGKSRLLLDNIFVDNEMLYLVDGDKKYNMFELRKNPELQTKSISTISWSPFCYHNAPKRIMMTAKLSTQSVPVEGQHDNFTNRVRARVVFADLKGYSYADAVIISESLAKRLRSKTNKRIVVKKDEIKDSNFDMIVNKLKSGDMDLTMWEFKTINPYSDELKFKNYENIKVLNWELKNSDVLIIRYTAEIPFGVGDKLTNLHGAKGVVGRILPDDQMPRLTQDIGDFKAGPMEIVLSGYSVMRRGSLGQIFEAWANASNTVIPPNQDFFKIIAEEYGEQMKEFASKSTVEFEDVTTIKPIGEIDIIRLLHHAPSKSSRSFLKSNTSHLLKLEEMIKLNLSANGCKNILQEFSLRSAKKHNQPYGKIKYLMETGELPENMSPKLSFALILKSMGIDMRLDGESLIPTDNRDLDVSEHNIVSDDELTLKNIKEIKE